MKPGEIEITGVNLKTLVKIAYGLSQPQGLGHFHYQKGDLSDEDIEAIVKGGEEDLEFIAVSMDYVKGRAVKLTVRRDDGRLSIPNKWFDHTDAQLRDLLTLCGFDASLIQEARDDKRRYDERCLAEAKAFLKEKGGSWSEERAKAKEDPLTKEQRDGLYVGLYSKTPSIKETYKNFVNTYTLLPA